MSRGMDSVWYRGDDCFRELMQCLTEPHHIWAEDMPHLVAALNEVLAWCRDRRGYNDRFRRNSWSSVIADFRHSVKNIGSALTTLTAPATTVIDGKLRDDIAADAADVADLEKHVRDALDLLTTDDALLAAWKDLLTSCNKDTPPIESVCLRHDTFWAVAELAGRPLENLAMALTKVLSGDPWALHEARVALGEVPPSESGPQEHTPHVPGAGSPVSDPKQRLKTAEGLLKVPPRPVDHVVWLAFDNAGLTSTVQAIGPVTFYEGYALGPVLAAEDSDRSGLPAEFQTTVPIMVPEGPHVVMARVELGTDGGPDPVRRARKLVHAMAAYAATRAGGSLWTEFTGHIHVQDGQITRSMRFGLDRIETTFRPDLDATAAGLARYSGTISSGLPGVLATNPELVDALQWWHLAEGQPGAQAVFLNVRTIEVLAALTSDKDWDRHLEKYWKSIWIRRQIGGEVSDALLESLFTGYVIDGGDERQREIRQLVRGNNLGQPTFDTQIAAQHFEEVAGLLHSRTTLARHLRTLARRAASPENIAQWVGSLEERWSISLHRLERVRNAIAHGGPVTEDAVFRVLHFSRQLSAWVIVETLDAVMTAKPLDKAQQQLLDEAEAWRTQLQTASSIPEIL
ncbi:hypothetical protein [Actinoplanes sp. NPDC049802]|uniref:hypothetical protein n=1 Tax=Actinoplanes sp. NPDC049802 TaxID=3154742 RepID=UPI0033FD2D3C